MEFEKEIKYYPKEKNIQSDAALIPMNKLPKNE